MKPTLAKDYTKFTHKVEFPCVVMPKLDGVRAILRRATDEDEIPDDGQLHFFTRTSKAWNDNVVAHILEPMRKRLSVDTVVDGEFYVHGKTCQWINGAIAARRKEPSSDTISIQYHVFDMVKPGNFTSRMSTVFTLLNGCENVEIVSYDEASSHEEIKECYATYMSLGYEGAMVRNSSCEYEFKRTHNLLKYKTFMDAEFKCISIERGADEAHSVDGKYHNTLGKIVLETVDGKQFRCGSGFTDEQRNYYWLHPEAIIGEEITVKFFELTEDGVPRFPIFQGVRNYE